MTLSHPSGTGGAPGIRVIYFCHIFNKTLPLSEDID